MISTGLYKLKEEFFPMVGIAVNQWKARKEDLLSWIANFFDYKLLEGKPLRIEILEVYGEYRPLPRKMTITNIEEKIKDYETFTIAALGTEFKPNSKSRVARQAIETFGFEKYGHESKEAVVRRFVKPAFDKYGESDGIHKWVWYSSYELLPQEILDDWRNIMKEEHISEREAANAFYRQEQGMDITKEKMCFAAARARFKEKYGEFPILVESWRVRGGQA